METVIVINDLQIEYHDVRSLKAVENYLVDNQPDHLVYNGDIFDFSGLTTKYLRTPKHRFKLEKGLDVGKEMFARHRMLLPDTHLIFNRGNHEDRFDVYVYACADELSFLLKEGNTLTLESLMNMQEFGVESTGAYDSGWLFHSFLIKHGEIVSKYAPEKELSMEGISGMSGHVHRGGSHFKRDRKGAHVWYANFCLCNLDGPKRPPGYRRGQINDWEQGFSVIKFDGSIFNVYPIVITNHKFIGPDGKVYKP